MRPPASPDEILALELVEHAADMTLPALPRHAAILVFGHQLEPDGGLRPRLHQRLAVAHALAEANPQAPIVVTGGRLGAPISEAEAMGDWLVARGVDPVRIHREPLAEDTVGNALRSVPILAGLGVPHARLVSSTYHIRRSLILLNAVAARHGLAITFDHLAAPDPSLATPRSGLSDAERALIAADLARIMAVGEE